MQSLVMKSFLFSCLRKELGTGTKFSFCHFAAIRGRELIGSLGYFPPGRLIAPARLLFFSIYGSRRRAGGQLFGSEGPISCQPDHNKPLPTFSSRNQTRQLCLRLIGFSTVAQRGQSAQTEPSANLFNSVLLPATLIMKE